MNLLKQFYTNKAEREEVKDFLMNTLAEITVEKAFAGEDVKGVKEAVEAIDEAFNKLEVEYGEKIEHKPQDSR